MKTKISSSSIFLALSGFIITVLGLYFIFLRPALLPEDLRFMGTSLDQIQRLAPGLLIWLQRVFWVMGGYMFATGLLTIYIALATFRTQSKSAQLVVMSASLSSIGWMAIINFTIDSDFKWLILLFNIPWIVALALSWRTRSKNEH